MNLIKIDELKEPPVVGQTYLVPCILKWKTNPKKGERKRECTPIINYLHSDKENGQNYQHYHVDARFIQFLNLTRIKGGKLFDFTTESRYNLIDGNKNYEIEYIPLRCQRNVNYGIGGDVSKSKLKHKCITKGKCVHRGYDLSQVVPVDGIIKCPLHGLSYNATTKELIQT